MQIKYSTVAAIFALVFVEMAAQSFFCKMF